MSEVSGLEFPNFSDGFFLAPCFVVVVVHFHIECMHVVLGLFEELEQACSGIETTG
jgi:hypothetical protein